MRLIFCVLFLFLSCQQKQSAEVLTKPDTVAIEVTPEDAFGKPENNYDYTQLFGVYDHESTTKGFSAVLSLRQNGNDLYFTSSVVQGGCKGETEGVILMLDQNQNYYSGFYESEDCRLQFTFILAEKKVDVKEVSLCKFLESGCSFEGTYLKRSI
jgi:hypothetical protein